jgi:hypothetical protein
MLPIRNNLLGLCLMLSCISVITSSCINFIPVTKTRDEATQQAEAAIKKDNVLRELEDVCAQMPVFQDYALYGKDSGKNIRFVSHFFSSPTREKVDYPELRRFYSNFLLQMVGR